MPKRMQITLSDPTTGKVLDQFVVTDWRQCCDEDEGVGTRQAENLLLARIVAVMEIR